MRIMGVVFWVVVVCVIGMLRLLVRAIKNAVIGRESYFGEPQLRLINDIHKGTGFAVKRVMFRGMLPNDRDMNVSFALSVLDVTGGKDKHKPIFSLIDVAQEERTICYCMSGNFGHVGKSVAITDWIQLGVVVPDLLQPPHSGERKIHVVVRMFNSDNPPIIFGGIVFGGSLLNKGKVILSKGIVFTHEFAEKGYEEASRDREESQAISLKIGIAVATSDGSLKDAEGKILKNWVEKQISALPDTTQKRLKSVFNKALKEGFEEAIKGSLSLSKLVERLSEIGEKKEKYDAIELCLEIMAADGIAAPEEMAVIRNVAEGLGLDMDEIEKMRDKFTLKLSTKFTSEQDLESLVGVEDSWPAERKCKYLRFEFQKWNNRLNALPEGKKRESAQNMLGNIAILRKKYGC